MSKYAERLLAAQLGIDPTASPIPITGATS